MKPFSPRFCLLVAPLLLVAQGSLSFAAPADRDGAVKYTPALPWLSGLLPLNPEAGDEFSRAVTTLEECRTAENNAVRRAVRGEITQGELQTYRSATQTAEQRVEALLLQSSKPATVLQAQFAPQGSKRTVLATQTGPNLRVPSLVSVPPQRGADQMSTRQATTPAPNMSRPPSRPLPRLTLLDHTIEGSIVAPAYGTRQLLHQPQKAGARPKIAFVAMLPQDSPDVNGSKSSAAMPTATKTTVALAPPVPARTPAPTSAPLVSQPLTIPPAKTGTPEVKAPETKAPNNSVAAKSTAQPAADLQRDLQRFAQLDAELKRADKRLSAANDALSDGQQQLTRFADTLRQAMLDAGPDAVGLHPFVKVAEKYAGTPYVWGGESRNGFDCSGMIIRVMRDLGYKALPHSAAEQFRYGKPIAQPLLKPGDLVFFANTYKAGISHVGIYLGKRRFIHAAGTGKGTIVSSLDTAKFQEKYAGARRLISARGN